jgi:hypothetical protein
MLRINANEAAAPTELSDGQEFAIEEFESKMSWLTEDELATEAKGKPRKGRLGRMIFEFATADTFNRNRRVYPAETFKAALVDLQSRIGDNKVFGNLDHPSAWDYDSLTVQLKDACVKVVEATMTNDTEIRVVVDILDNDHGRQLMSVLEAIGNPGISQRAIARWREPTEDERQRHKVPKDEYMVVAESLRLITYDIVSDPGFSDADGAQVRERHTAGVQTMNIEQLRKEHQALYSEVFNLGKVEGEKSLESKVADAIEAQKPTIASEAVAAIQKKLDEANEQKQKLVDQLAPLKAALEQLGIVNEKMTDTEAAAKVATTEAALKASNEKVAALEAEKKALETKVAEAADEQKVLSNIKTINEIYKDSPHRTIIVREVAKTKFTDLAQMKAAAEDLAGMLKEAGGDGTTTPPTSTDSIDQLVNSLTGNQKPADESNNGITKDGGDPNASEARQQKGVLGFMSSRFVQPAV